MSEANTAQSTETETQAAPAVIVRRVYVNHKQFGTCVTFKAVVYLAPAGALFEPKSTPKINMTVSEGCLLDEAGREWLPVGENPGCGPRLPKALRAEHGAAFKAMNIAQRKAFLKSLAPAAEAAK